MRKSEKYSVKASQLLKFVKKLLRQGTIKRLTITDTQKKFVAVIAPVLPVVAALSQIMSECIVTVERVE